MKEKIETLLFQRNIKKVYAYIKSKNIQVVSFDIFDTLLVRPVISPKDVLYIASEQAKKQYGITDFIKMRYEAESFIPNNSNINDIWNSILFRFNLSETTANNLKSIELSSEKKLLYSRRLIKEIYNFAIKNNKKVIAISDMYLPETFIRKVLESCGYDKISGIYISCDCGLRKDDGGRLFDYVIEKERISKKQMIHIGDNFRSDYLFPNQKGIKSLYIPSNIKLASALYNIDFYKIKNNSLRMIMGFSVNAIFEKDSSSNILSFTREKVAKLLVFPLISSIVFLCANKECFSQEYENIWFASRDGYLPSKALTIYRNMIINTIKGKYIYASRLAYNCLSEKSFFDYFNYLENYDFKITLEKFLDNSVLNNKLLSKIKKQIGYASLKKIIVSDDHFRKLLSPFWDELEKAFYEKQQNCKEYYLSLKPTEKRRIIVFDCGYSGSVSKGISLAYDNEYYIDKIYLWETNANKLLDKQFMTRTYVVVGENIKNGIDLFTEMMLSSQENSCIGFLKEDGNIVPVLSRNQNNSLDNNEIITIQKVALSTFSDFCKLFDNDCQYMYIEKFEFYSELYENLFIKSKRRLKILSNICFLDDFFDTGKQKLISRMGKKSIKAYIKAFSLKIQSLLKRR